MLEIATNFTDDNYRGNTNAISILKMRFLRLYGELRQLISTKQKEGIQEQDTFNGYRWPYQVATFTTSSGTDERHSSYGFI